MFGGLDDPDQSDAARGDGPFGVTGDEGADVGDLVGYTHAGGEEEDGPVGGEGAGKAVGTFDQGS